jgi:hypothetical protein
MTIALVLVAPASFATCPTAPQGPYAFGGGPAWMDYTPTSNSCIYTEYATPTTMWCFSEPAYSIGSTMAVVSYDFDINDSDLSGQWDADMFLEFNDPNNSVFNWVEMFARVTHNGVTTSTRLFEMDGTDGDVSCGRRGGSFTAANGDHVKIITYAKKGSANATLQVGMPHIYAYY